ncbi:MAG: choice-of-anchor G family protein [Leucobacter sp.]
MELRQPVGRGPSRARPVAILTAAAMVAGPAIFGSTAAFADDYTTAADSAAHGHWLALEGLGIDVVGAAYTKSEFPATVGPVSDPLNVSVLNGLGSINLGTLALPLIKPSSSAPGLLELGNLGAIASYSASPSATNSVASSGLINSDGSLNIDAASSGNYGFAKLDASQLLSQLLGDQVRDALLDEASIQIGALGSQATSDTGTIGSEYMLTDLKLDVHSPAVGGVVNTVNTTLGTALQPIQDLLGPGGGIESILGGLVRTIGALPLVNASLNDASIDTAPLLDTVRQKLLQEPLANTDNSVIVDLSTGAIRVDLASLVVDRSGATSLSTMPANTEVLHGDTVNAILDGVTDALTGNGPNSAVSKIVDTVTEGL